MLDSVIKAQQLVLPRTKGRYRFDMFSNLYDNFTGELILSPNQAEKKVNLEGTVYADNFTHVELFALTYKPLFIPFDMFSEVSLCKRSDCTLTNDYMLTGYFWKFKKPIEAREYPGFRYIPGFTKYLVNEYGDVISTRNAEFLSQHVSSVGYLSVRITCDTGASIIASVHTLVSLAWCEYGDDICSLMVDHLNGDKNDNYFENLEWVTQGENNRRAHIHGLRNKRHRRVFCKDLVTNETNEFDCPASVAKHLKVRNSAIFEYLNRINHNTAFKQKYLLWYSDIESPFIADQPIIRTGSQPRKLLVRNVTANDVVEYESAAKFLRSSNLTRKQLYGTLERNQQKLYGNVLFKYSDDSTPWIL